jgi:hypothetical protein
MDPLYDYSFLCTYKLIPDIDEEERNLMYQIQILDALKLRESPINIDIDEDILDNKINRLYDKVKDNIDVLKFLKESRYYQDYREDLLYVFITLFSYDYFDSFHRCLVEVFNKKQD